MSEKHDFQIKFHLVYDGDGWRLYNWRGIYCPVNADFSNITDAVRILLEDTAGTFERLISALKE